MPERAALITALPAIRTHTLVQAAADFGLFAQSVVPIRREGKQASL
jgi:hypothetical protein